MDDLFYCCGTLFLGYMKLTIFQSLVSNLKVLQVVVAIFATTAALKTLAWPAISNSLFATPAVTIHSLTMSRAVIGKKTFLTLALTKIRPCLPKSAVLTIVDVDGELSVVDTSWDLPLSIGTSSVRFHWTPPDTIAIGYAKSAILEVWHYECQDGPSPKESVKIRANILEVGLK
jgi:hypothetical protein